MAVQAQVAGATWGIPTAVRRTVKSAILRLRHAVEEDFGVQLAALGLRPDGVREPGHAPAEPEHRARELCLAVIAQETAAGQTHAAALSGYITAAAFTFINRAYGLRCLEARGLLLVDGQTETVFTQDPARGASSLYWRVRNALPPGTPPRELWRETLRRAGAAVTERVRVLFDPDDEYAALLPRQPVLDQLVATLNAPEVPAETYREDELLGWVYMYYGAEEKDAVYARLAKGAKLERPEDVSAASCLYTERYMVDYLLQNTLGRLWTELHPQSRLPTHWPYFVRPAEPEPGGAADTRPPGPTGTAEESRSSEAKSNGPSPRRGGLGEVPPSRHVRDITLLDPAVGSGHFLVRAFDLLAAMYAEEGIEDPAEVPALILERNLHGIDIDARAVQIAALALYLKGCALAGPDFRPRRLNLVSTDVTLAGAAPPADYLARFRDDPELEALVRGIWTELRDARQLGSLLHPERAVDAIMQRRRARERGGFWEHDESEWERWKLDLLEGLREQFEAEAHSEDLGRRLFGEQAAKGISLVEALSGRYDVVVANPPYAGGKNLNPRMKQVLEREYKDGKRDLYAAFILRCRDFCRPGGRVGMVTQQSWMFLRSFATLRKGVLNETTVETIAHLGEHGFEESAAAGAFVALFTLRATPPEPEHQLSAYRLVGPKSPVEKDLLLWGALAGRADAVVSTPRQSAFRAIPEMPFVYWLRPRFFELLQSDRRLKDVAEVRQGLATTDNERFLRCFWEVVDLGPVVDGHAASGRWFWYAKGGRYQKWAGLDWLVVNWWNDGAEIKNAVVKLPGTTHWSRRVASADRYFQPGLTYTPITRGSLGIRLMTEAVFGHKGMAVFPPATKLEEDCSILNARLLSFLARATGQSLGFESGQISVLPMPLSAARDIGAAGQVCMALKSRLVSADPTERRFGAVPLEPAHAEFADPSLKRRSIGLSSVQVYLHTLEGYNERLICDAYDLLVDDVQAVMDDTGTPAGWFTLVGGYEVLPEPSEGIELSSGLHDFLATLPQHSSSPAELARLKARLRTLYQAGPGARVEETDDDGVRDAEDEEGAVLGARIPIPTETFLEELSQKLEIHPISVFRLLEEMREQEGLVSPPEVKRQLEDYVSVSLLRLLGYRWPEQDRYEAEHGPILPADLVKADGILPLVDCGDGDTAEGRVRQRLERKFGDSPGESDEGAERSLREFRQYAGRELGEWLRRDFFKRHIQQFKQRPIAWHFSSPEGTFQAFVLYHRLSRSTLQALRTRYAGGLIERLRVEQERARQRGAASDASRLQAQIEDVEEFNARLEQIERGDTLKSRIRCRWKDEDAGGRPGPYAPDIDDGVKVNIRPFQELGLLSVKQVIKKW